LVQRANAPLFVKPKAATGKCACGETSFTRAACIEHRERSAATRWRGQIIEGETVAEAAKGEPRTVG